MQEILNNLPQAVPKSELVPLNSIVLILARTAKYSNSDFLIIGKLLDKTIALTFPNLNDFKVFLYPIETFPDFITNANYGFKPSCPFFNAILIYNLYFNLIFLNVKILLQYFHHKINNEKRLKKTIR